MITALSVSQINEKAKEDYPDEQRVVGIILARYNMNLVKSIVDSEFFYWHYNSCNKFNIYWPGYGEYKFSDFLPTEMPLDCKENIRGVYFDLKAFISSKNTLRSINGFEYNDEPVLFLVQFDRDRIVYDEYIRIDLEKNLDAGNKSIRNILEFLTDECAEKSTISELSRSIKTRAIFKTIKGIKASEAISIILDIVGIAVSLA